MLEQADQYDQNQARAKVISQLGQWIESQPPVDDWSADPLITTLPGRYAGVFRYAPIDSMKFVATDYHAIGEAIWLRQIADWQVRKLREAQPELFLQVDDLAAELRKLERDLDTVAADLPREKDVEKKRGLQEQQVALKQQEADTKATLTAAQDHLALAKADWLFDWTMRNIQLDHTHWNATLSLPGENADNDSDELIPPPGAAYHGWQALLLGHGDAVNRARLFLLLCRQAHIDVVVLGLKSTEENQSPREWAAAVLIGEQAYLFDAELGTAIPGPDGAPHVTLATLRKQPELLRHLDTDEQSYHVQAKDLKRVVPLIDAGIEALSQRMMLVEQSLKQQQQLVLTSAPSPLARRLRRLSLPDASVWEAPYRVYIYESLRQRNEAAASAFFQETAVFVPPIELLRARLHHFRGQVDEPQSESTRAAASATRAAGDPVVGERYEHGARHYYLACRSPEGEFDTIEKELDDWFARFGAEQLIGDLAILKELEKRRAQLRAGDIDPAEQFIRQRQDAEILELDPEAVGNHRRGRHELTKEELEVQRDIEKRLQVLSSATRDWINRLRPEMVAIGEAQLENYLDHFKRVATQAKYHATWWLAIAAMESGDLGVAADLIEQRILNGDPESPWVEHAHHQLGRIYETAGQSEKAIEHYQADQSPQRAGSLVRAKRLAQP